MTINKKKKILLPYFPKNSSEDSFSLTKDHVLNKTIIDNLESDVFVLDKDLNIVLMNKAAEKTWGVLFEDVKGTSYPTLKLKTIEKNMFNNLSKVIKAKKTFNVKEVQFFSPDNITRFLDLSCMPILDENGQVQGVVSVGKDVTKRVNKEIQLKRKQKKIIDLTIELEVKEKEIEHLKIEVKEKYSFHNIIGKNFLMQKIYNLIERVAKTDTTVLITGETGTGKELVAKAVHYNSNRAKENLITVNCAALPDGLLESELFGHIKGSFTGAIRDKKGKFELADKGTLFLDEIGDLPLLTQVKLLRAIQEKEIERVGDEKKIKVNIRIIAATNKNLPDLIKNGKFREDLFYRLNIISIKIPSLRERVDDIPLLVNSFIKKYNKEFKKDISGISQFALKKLTSHSWPGNVRELEALIERTILLEEEKTINDVQITLNSNEIIKTGQLLPEPKLDPELNSYNNMLTSLELYEKEYFISVFKKFSGKIIDIAKYTGLNRRSIQNKMKKFKIKKSDFK